MTLTLIWQFVLCFKQFQDVSNYQNLMFLSGWNSFGYLHEVSTSFKDYMLITIEHKMTHISFNDQDNIDRDNIQNTTRVWQYVDTLINTDILYINILMILSIDIL